MTRTSHFFVFCLFLLLAGVCPTSAYIDTQPNVPCSPTNKCIDPLMCQDSVCVVPADYPCKTNGARCKTGTVCVGTEELRLCKMPMTVGQQCDLEPYWVCSKDLECRDTICTRVLKLGEIGPCGDASSNIVCGPGLTCTPIPSDNGNENGVCSKVIDQPGGTCDPSGSIICGKGLTCENKVCKIKENEDCNKGPVFCQIGTKCVGNNDSGRQCKTPVPLGGSCATPLQVCGKSLVCDQTDKKCKLPENAICTNAPDHACVSTTKCVGTANKKQCKTPIPVGEFCDQVFRVCKTNLLCEGKLCKVPEDGDCSANGSVCVRGTLCVGANGDKKCKTPIPVGKACDVTDPFSVCAGGNSVECEDGTCKIKEGQKCCKIPNPVCVDGTYCVGSSTLKRCEKPIGAGGQCNTPFKRCVRGLMCEDKICKTPEDGDCNDDASVCVTGTKCVGDDGAKKCKTLIPVGKSCSPTDPLSVCEGKDDVTCENGTCKVKNNKICSTYAKPVCVDGSKCIGTSSAKKCKKPIGAGGSCGTPFSECESSLTCENFVCKIDEDGNCSETPGQCRTPLVCVGNGDDRECRQPIPLGGGCGPQLPFAQCDKRQNLVCDANQNACKVSISNKCSADDDCVSGAKCVGSGAVKQCQTPVGPGGTCNRTPFQQCGQGLVCDQYRCRFEEGEECDKEENHKRLCKSGTACVGPANNQICKAPVEAGEACDNVLEICRNPLKCQDNICKVPVDGNCGVANAVCVTGSKCVGPNGNRQCKIPNTVGKPCNPSNPFLFCASGLVCDQHKCCLPANAPCSAAPNACVSGTRCVGPDDNKRCQAPVRVNGACQVTEQCKAGLVCDNNKCKRELQANCQVGECKSGTRCVLVGEATVCVKRIGAGGSCGNSKLGACDPQLICMRKTCVPRNAIPEWYPCNLAGVSGLQCADGLVCVGRSTSQYCVKAISEGGHCKTSNPFLKCGNGLECVQTNAAALGSGICMPV